MFTLQLPGVHPWDAVEVSPENIKETPVPWSGRTVSGYGGNIPTQYMIRHGNRWHRVRVMVYGNAGTAYIRTRDGLAYVERF